MFVTEVFKAWKVCIFSTYNGPECCWLNKKLLRNKASTCCALNSESENGPLGRENWRQKRHLPRCTLLEKVSIMLYENGALIIKHLSFFTVTIFDEFHTVANLGWILKCTQCEIYKLSHTCKIRKLNKVIYSLLFFFLLVWKASCIHNSAWYSKRG